QSLLPGCESCRWADDGAVVRIRERRPPRVQGLRRPGSVSQRCATDTAMARGVVRKLACGARVHAWLIDGRYVRRKCTDRYCREAQWAKQRGELAIHVWDIQTNAE